MHDRLTGAVFRVSASNVQQDSILYNDTWQDGSWDAVWQSEVTVDDDGWSVEMRITLSQLRFPPVEQQTRGVNVERFIDLTGLDGIRPRRNLELLPYTAARAEFVRPRAGNPFNDGSRLFGAAGLDAKWAVTSNLRLSATINPDFGRSRSTRPSSIRRRSRRSSRRRRPFFLEGSQIFSNFGYGGSNNYWGFNMSEPTIRRSTAGASAFSRPLPIAKWPARARGR
jgi:hypothetical protein